MSGADLIIAAPALATLPVQGTEKRFPVRRAYCVGRKNDLVGCRNCQRLVHAVQALPRGSHLHGNTSRCRPLETRRPGPRAGRRIATIANLNHRSHSLIATQ